MSADYRYTDSLNNEWIGYAHNGWIAAYCEGLDFAIDQATVDAVNALWKMHQEANSSLPSDTGIVAYGSPPMT